MKSVALVPYCPLPTDTGGKVEIMKYLDVLRELGPCTILSAGNKPVGSGWTADSRRQLESRGFKVILREEEYPQRSWVQWLGITYAAVFKGLRMERAFGHSNPYHRYAFPSDWFLRHTMEADIVLINYSYWAHLPSAAPKVMVLLDLWSQYMWEGSSREKHDLRSCDAVFVISKGEEKVMRDWKMRKLIWCPPAVSQTDLPVTDRVGLVGSANPFNIEGLRWLESSALQENVVRVYGRLAKHVRCSSFDSVGYYIDDLQPYRECGIILFTTVQGMGVQIKTIEALAAGRAIVARRGAMRGIPPSDEAWIEVDTPEQMWEMVRRLQVDKDTCSRQMAAAREYYQTYLHVDRLRATIASVLTEVANQAL